MPSPTIGDVITDPGVVRILCFGDSGTYGTCLRDAQSRGTPTKDPDYIRLDPDRRWTGVLQRTLGDRYEVIEEGLNGRTTDVDDGNRPGLNGRSYFLPCLLSHQPLDVVVIMLGGNDLKPLYARTPRMIADALGCYVDDVAANATDGRGRVPTTILVGHILVDDTAPRYRDLVGENMDAQLPDRFRALSEAMRLVARSRGVSFVDPTPVAHAGDDGVHLSMDSHSRLGELIAAEIMTASSRLPSV